ncbi:MAG: hypothetical protein J5780_05665 [Treponema sp.]|nr:hypothetical protein [Treponema sp.]
MKKLILSAVFFITGAICVFAEESVEKLLTGYFKNNLELHNLLSKVQKQDLNSQATEISNGINIQLSTGTVMLNFGSENSFSLEPELSLSVPQANNLTFSASSDVKIEDGVQKKLSDITFTLGADLYSGAAEKTKITLLESERSLLEAKRALQNGFLSAEKEFYTSLKNLYSLASQIVTQEKNLYEDKLSFEKIRAQGYSTSSTAYRLAQSEVAADEHKVQVYRHKLERETRIFASKCGAEYSGDALSFLPQEIPSVEGIDVHSFKKENFTKIEKASWEKYINDLKRKADKSFYLRAYAGYSFDKVLSSYPSDTYYDTINAGLSCSWDNSGLTATAGAYVPVNTDKSPYYTLSLAINPAQFFLHSIDEKLSMEDEKQENISLESAETDYVTAVITQASSLEDILWNKKANEETYDMYSTLEKDTATYFSKGIITESEYKSAQVNKENYRLQILINNLELIIYNNETKLLFTRDGELYDGKEKAHKI